MKYKFSVVLLLISYFAIAQDENIQNSGYTISKESYLIIDSSASEYWLLQRSTLDNNNVSGNYKLLLPPPTNDNCASATTITVGGAESCMNTDNGTVQVGEGVCRGLAGGAAYETVWYKFQATSTSTTISLNNTGGATSCGTDMAMFGGFATSAAADAACLPGAGVQVGTCVLFSVYDPGFGYTFTTVSGQWYLITIQNQSCGGPGVRDYIGCIRLFNTPSNNTASGASGISSCGVLFNGTNIGYSPTNTLPGAENLDGNAGTTCGACTAGDDVSFVVNNDSWFSFCAVNAGTWNIVFNGIAGCYYGNGLQMAIFRGTPTNLTQIETAPSPSLPGSSWTSSTFAVAAGECIYMVVDGFAGDQCNYSYTLNNVTGGCIILPIELLSFNATAQNKNLILLTWNTASESNNDYFTIERTIDGVSFETIGVIDGAGNSTNLLSYSSQDTKPHAGTSYYRLKQTDYDGNYSYSALKMVTISDELSTLNISVLPNPADKSEGAKIKLVGNPNDVVLVSMYDVTGKVVEQNKVVLSSTGEASIETNRNIQSGMYFFNASTQAGQSINQKFIVK